ncbi:polymeric immunoglobulin receptor-like isoform X4 [Ictalurus furcatus]|uniref:polymeric immunoglobulin receptor-like isoform X4 n=1 Tax=Ictalurus furcatus TaxID=66913 RepID=UPI0023501146|nr:polymeric immunoglobulin receptor-like isoform X4 [Ictalurus furcatus]
MKILLIFTLCLISDGGDSKEVTGYSGGGVLIKCKYDTEYTQNKKYFCKGSWLSCSDQIRTGAKNEWINSGRFSLFDDTKSADFSVMIRELTVTVRDTGTYYCGVDLPSVKDISTWVELKVKEDLSYEKSISKTVHVGGDLTVSCKYPESLRSNPKFLCKTRLQDSACSYKASVNESRKYVNEGKFSLYDVRETQMFTVSIRNVTEQDSGEYWCGAEAAWTSDHGYKVYFTQINLTVTGPPAGFPASTVITVSVILLLLLIGIIFLFVILHKKCRIQVGGVVSDTVILSMLTNNEHGREETENEPIIQMNKYTTGFPAIIKSKANNNNSNNNY